MWQSELLFPSKCYKIGFPNTARITNQGQSKKLFCLSVQAKDDAVFGNPLIYPMLYLQVFEPLQHLYWRCHIRPFCNYTYLPRLIQFNVLTYQPIVVARYIQARPLRFESSAMLKILSRDGEAGCHVTVKLYVTVLSRDGEDVTWA